MKPKITNGTNKTKLSENKVAKRRKSELDSKSSSNYISERDVTEKKKRVNKINPESSKVLTKRKKDDSEESEHGAKKLKKALGKSEEELNNKMY